MLALDRNALICDMAETYHIYDFRTLPARQLAVFACGLRENARIQSRAAKLKTSIDTYLLAAINDGLRLLLWMLSDDGRKNRRRPIMISDAMLDGANNGQVKETARGYNSVAAFEAARETFLRR